jgi:Concanavalin A-like lectin/glucanases superfamily
MARDFTKDTANYTTYTNGTAMRIALSGLNKISVSAWIKGDSFGTAGIEDNAIFALDYTGIAYVCLLNIHATAGAKLAAHYYSDLGSDRSHRYGTSTINTGTIYHVGAMYDYLTSSDDIEVYVNGSLESGATGGSSGDSTPIPTTGSVTSHLGCWGTVATARQFDGLIWDVAVWRDELTADNFLALSKGISPLLIRPDVLVSYWPLTGYHSPEIDLCGISDFTITGSIPAAPQGKIYSPPSSLWIPPSGSSDVTPPTIGMNMFGR